jgi:hypothetical protein
MQPIDSKFLTAKAIKTMHNPAQSRPIPVLTAAIVALLFGALTVVSGGSVVLFDGPARQAAGNYIPFVVWFNFLAGFAYIIAGIGLYLWRKWAVILSMVIAVATVLVFAAMGIHIIADGAYETRTVAAMAFRSIVWIAIAILARRAWKKANIAA